MTRKTLVETVGDACRQSGFDFGTGFEYRIASQIESLPAAWLETPVLRKTEGRNEGTKHYSLKINLMDRCDDHSPEAKERRWSELESSASLIISRVGANEDVRLISDIEFTPAEFSLTNGGELSLSITCTVQIPF